MIQVTQSFGISKNWRVRELGRNLIKGVISGSYCKFVIRSRILKSRMMNRLWDFWNAFTFIALICGSVIPGRSESWVTEDTVTIEAANPEQMTLMIHEPLGSGKVPTSRQFTFQFQYPGIGSWPGNFPGGGVGAQRPPLLGTRPAGGNFPVIGSRPPLCYTAGGAEGECATFRQCYPILYSVEGKDGDEEVINNPGLAEMINATAGPCKASTSPHDQFRFTADVEIRQHLICCSGHNKRPGPPTLRPPFQVPQQQQPPRRPGGAAGGPGSGSRPINKPQPPTPPPFPQQQQPGFPTPRPTPSPGSQKVDNPSTCGQPYVVGGSESTKGKHPWIVALTNNGRQFCGGSLISSSFVLTAAHCVAHMSANDVARIRVHLGEHTIGVGENTEQFEKVSRVMYHRGFSHQTLHNDVALLKLQSPARETQYIRPVCLTQDTRQVLDNIEVTLAGWGQVFDGGSQSVTLREVSMKVWSNSECATKYGNRAPAGIISSMICAGSVGKDACRGDSGGPLVYKNSRNVFEQVGVVSWGIGCGQYPGVYSRISHFLSWIEKNRQT